MSLRSFSLPLAIVAVVAVDSVVATDQVAAQECPAYTCTHWTGGNHSFFYSGLNSGNNECIAKSPQPLAEDEPGTCHSAHVDYLCNENHPVCGEGPAEELELALATSDAGLVIRTVTDHSSVVRFEPQRGMLLVYSTCNPEYLVAAMPVSRQVAALLSER